VVLEGVGDHSCEPHSERMTVLSEVQVDENGIVTADVKTGDTYPDAFRIRALKLNPLTRSGSSSCGVVFTSDFIIGSVDSVSSTLTVDPTGQALSLKPGSGGRLTADVTAGPDPAFHVVNGQIDVTAPFHDACGNGGTSGGTWFADHYGVL